MKFEYHPLIENCVWPNGETCQPAGRASARFLPSRGEHPSARKAVYRPDHRGFLPASSLVRRNPGVFQDPKILERVKRAQETYFLELTRGEYGSAYIEGRLKIGAVHERVGLPVKAYLGMYSFYLRAALSHLLEAYGHAPERALRAYRALEKVVFLDIALAIDTYVNRREQLIAKQQDVLRELPTAVLQVRERILILTGLSPQIAQALVAIGVDLGHVKTTLDLQSGLEQAEQLLGYRLMPIEQGTS